MSVKIMSLVWDTKNYFSTHEKIILLKLADCAADDGTHAYPSYQTIADECSMSRRRAISTITRLYDNQVLNKNKRSLPNGDSTSNMYQINIKMLQEIGRMSEKINSKKHVNNHVDNPCITGENNTSGSDAPSLEVVTQRHPGSDAASPKPSIDPSYESSFIENTTKNQNLEPLGLLNIQIFSGLAKIQTPPDKSLIQLAKEIQYFVINRDITKYKSERHALNTAFKKIREGQWGTPRGMKHEQLDN